ncbi:hypothetical protein JZO70_05235 [Enterococcus sp. 669A]|uniref:Pore-forming protein n=1 Tax=Candidatus Enterococcus moelleringii TaxID=2815325 RepID=A0ABS3L7G3_9ENTE|nr:hypothetical protein [Enterococcus sp. 669A]MBO1305552.1 hypothetical protein [Enterococcus sp. 669A]
MKKIIVWNIRQIIQTLFILAFLVYWCTYAYEYGYAERISFWLFFPLSIVFFCWVLIGQITIIKVERNRLEVLTFFGLRKKDFDMRHITVRFGKRVKPHYKAVTMYPIDIIDNHTSKSTRINCDWGRSESFKEFWEEL